MMVILEVDDDSDDREMFLDAVNAVDPGISCIQVESGLDALAYLADASPLPDFIFMDVNMPKMTGYECVSIISTMPGMNDIQIVMYSTAFDSEDQRRFSGQGIRYLGKPTRFIELVEALKDLIADKFGSMVAH
jgi:CheY-like chemotaxis protein